jgi:winged helix DNA-binding protein
VDHRRQARRPAAISLTWKHVRARRLARGALTERSPSLVDVARGTGGIHAQVQASAELQLASRVEGITQQDVRDALWRDRTLVKAWTLRGTLHLHPADELPLWFAARGAVSGEIRDLAAWPDPTGVVHPPVSAAEGAKLQAAVWDAFAGDEALLRDELATRVVKRAGRKHEGRLRSGFAFFTGELCQGPPQRNKTTLVRPDQWLGKWEPVEPEDALREILRRFLHAYGPARPADFREWFGADVPFDLVDVEEVHVEGHRAFVLAGDTEFPELRKSVRLLPEYDVYVMGFREREHLVPERVRAQVAAHGRGRYEGPAGVRFLLVDGVAAGLWERKKSARRLEVTVTPVGRVNRASLAAEAERLAAFLGVEPVLTVA